jgi:hypothetical protein
MMVLANRELLGWRRLDKRGGRPKQLLFATNKLFLFG